jgi:uncharacterized membrane protein
VTGLSAALAALACLASLGAGVAIAWVWLRPRAVAEGVASAMRSAEQIRAAQEAEIKRLRAESATQVEAIEREPTGDIDPDTEKARKMIERWSKWPNKGGPS